MTEPLTLTGERTLPGIPDESYWYARHLVAYDFAAARARGRRVLDAGCGEGYGAARLAQAGASDVVAVDLDQAVVSHVRRAYPAVGAVRAELGALPFRGGTFDLVVSLQVIEHVWDPEGYLRSLRSVLSAEGELILTTPNRLTFPPGNPFHVREFSARELAEAAEEAGLLVVDMLGIHEGLLLRGAGAVYGQVATRLAEGPPETWPRGLRLVVRRTHANWFDIRADHPDAALDLLAVCRAAP
jgi:SAM-dependent methyltransferase